MEERISGLEDMVEEHIQSKKMLEATCRNSESLYKKAKVRIIGDSQPSYAATL